MKSRIKPGDKVLIIQDCREGHPATGQEATFVGDLPATAIIKALDDFSEYDYEAFVNGEIKVADGRPLCQIVPFWRTREGEPTPVKDGPEIFHPPNGQNPGPMYWFPSTNPCFELADGSRIWGHESWWTPVDEAPPLLIAQEALEGHKAILRGVIEVIAREIDDSPSQ